MCCCHYKLTYPLPPQMHTQLLLEPAAVLEYSDKISFKDSFFLHASTFNVAYHRSFKLGQASLLMHFIWSLNTTRPTVTASRPLTTLWRPLSRCSSPTYVVDLHCSLYPSPTSTLELKRNKIISPSQRNLSPPHVNDKVSAWFCLSIYLFIYL